MIKFYECYTTAADELNQKDFCLEVWGENPHYPVRMFYFSDYEGDSIYHWLMWCADEVVNTNVAKEIRWYAEEHYSEEKDMPKRYYSRPKQVKWFDSLDGVWVGGIAFGHVIICGCCGSTIELDDFEKGEVIEYDDWIDIEEEIRGEN